MNEVSPPYVAFLFPGKWLLEQGAKHQLALVAVSAEISVENERLVLTLAGTDDLAAARLVEACRDLGIPFSCGRGWSAADVVRDLKAKGLVTGRFEEICWSEPDSWRLSALD
jgi:hypothetical protein